MLIDLFTFSKHTAGSTLSVESIINRAKEIGLGGVCITDREHSKDAARWVELGAAAGIFVGVGVEICTEEGTLIAFPPAIDNFLLHEEWRELTMFGRPEAQETIDFLKELNICVIAGSLFDRHSDAPFGDRVFALKGLDAIDVVSISRVQLENDLAQEAAMGLKLPGVGGSRVKTALNMLGGGATLFSTEITNQAELVEALKDGDVWAASVIPRGLWAQISMKKHPPKEVEDDRERAPRRFGSDRGGDRRGGGGGDRRGGGGRDRRGGGDRDRRSSGGRPRR